MKTTIDNEQSPTNLKNSVFDFFLRIRGKLLLGFSAIVIILVIGTVLNIYNIEASKVHSSKLLALEIPSVLTNIEIKSEINASLANLSLWSISNNKVYRDRFQKNWQKIDSYIAKIDDYSRKWKSGKSLALWAEIKRELGSLQILQNKVLDSTNENTKALLHEKITPEVSRILTILGTIDNKVTSDASGLIPLQKAILIEDTASFIKDVNDIQLNQWIMMIVGALLAAFIAFFTAKRITDPLNNAIGVARQIASGSRDVAINTKGRDESADLLRALHDMQASIRSAETKLQDSEVQVKSLLDGLEHRVVQYRDLIKQVAAGDLRQRVKVEGDDDLAELGKHLNSMTGSLSNITGQIAKAIYKMGSNLNQVEEAMSSQAASASEQAAAVTETITIIDQIKETSTQTLEKANSLAESADRTRTEGQNGLNAVKRTTDGMHDIHSKVEAIAESILALTDKTKKISETTAAVNDLAERSKLLALNASIEAAKAGDAGKGFAVVAVEIKDLAEQSQHATAQVEEILEDIRKATEGVVIATEEGSRGVLEGLKSIDETGQVITHLGEALDESSASNHQIVAAVQQEAAGIEQIAQAISEINTATGQFVDFTNQTSAVAKQFAEISNRLQESIKIYKFDETDASSN